MICSVLFQLTALPRALLTVSQKCIHFSPFNIFLFEKSFLPTFETKVQQALNENGAKIMSEVSLLERIPLDKGDLVLDLEGGWSLLPDGSHTPGLLFTPQGMFLSQKPNSAPVSPPFPNPFSIPASVNQNPPTSWWSPSLPTSSRPSSGQTHISEISTKSSTTRKFQA